MAVEGTQAVAASAPAEGAPAASTPAAPAATPAAATPAAATAASTTVDGAATVAAATPAATLTAPAATATEIVYEEFKAPEGTVIDKTVTDAFKAVAKDLKLSQADAQKVIDGLAPVVAKGETARLQPLVDKAITERDAKRISDWTAAAKADPTIGGEKLTENMAVARKTFDAFGGPELGKFLEDSGLANHPLLLKWAFNIGQQIGPDNKLVGGSSAAATEAGLSFEERAAAKLYK